jgi:hypothetical protein
MHRAAARVRRVGPRHSARAPFEWQQADLHSPRGQDSRPIDAIARVPPFVFSAQTHGGPYRRNPDAPSYPNDQGLSTGPTHGMLPSIG